MASRGFERFCKQYPEYCSEQLYAKLFSDTVPIGMVHRNVGSRVKIRGVVVSVEKRLSKNNKVYYTGEICDKTGCTSFYYCCDESRLAKGDEIVAVGRVTDWKGRLDFVISSFEVLGNILSEHSPGQDEEGGEGDAGDPGQAQQPQSQQPAEPPSERFRKIMSEAISRGIKVRYEKALALARKLGLSDEEFNSMVEVYEDTLPNSIEKARFVRLRGG